MDSNLEIKWFDWGHEIASSDSISSNNVVNLKLSVEELIQYAFAPLDFAYVATRDIFEGEELFINYGSAWVHDWNHVSFAISDIFDRQMNNQNEVMHSCSSESQSCFLDDSGMTINTDEFPAFRRSIDCVEHLYQEHWLRRV